MLWYERGRLDRSQVKSSEYGPCGSRGWPSMSSRRRGSSRARVQQAAEFPGTRVVDATWSEDAVGPGFDVTVVLQVEGWVKPMASHNGVFVIRVISGGLLEIARQAGRRWRKAEIGSLNPELSFCRAFAESSMEETGATPAIAHFALFAQRYGCVLANGAVTRLLMLSTAVSHYTAEERASTRSGSVSARSNVGQMPGR